MSIPTKHSPYGKLDLYDDSFKKLPSHQFVDFPPRDEPSENYKNRSVILPQEFKSKKTMIDEELNRFYPKNSIIINSSQIPKHFIVYDNGQKVSVVNAVSQFYGSDLINHGGVPMQISQPLDISGGNNINSTVNQQQQQSQLQQQQQQQFGITSNVYLQPTKTKEENYPLEFIQQQQQQLLLQSQNYEVNNQQYDNYQYSSQQQYDSAQKKKSAPRTQKMYSRRLQNLGSPQQAQNLYSIQENLEYQNSLNSEKNFNSKTNNNNNNNNTYTLKYS